MKGKCKYWSLWDNREQEEQDKSSDIEQHSTKHCSIKNDASKYNVRLDPGTFGTTSENFTSKPKSRMKSELKVLHVNKVI